VSGFLVRNQLMPGTGGPLQANPLGQSGAGQNTPAPQIQSGTGGLDLAQPAWGGGGLGGDDMQQLMAAFHQHMQAGGFPAPGVQGIPGVPGQANNQQIQQFLALTNAPQGAWSGGEGGGGNGGGQR
jgi:hypothetical protein